MATQRTAPTRNGWIWTGVVIALLLVFYIAHRLTRTTLPVRAATVVRSSLKSTTSTNGVVEPVSNFEATAPFPGVVKGLYVHEGDQVPAGKLLLSMDDADARAKLATALANLKGAQAAYDATVKGGTQEELLSLNGQIQSAILDREQAQNSLATLEKLQMQGAASASEVAEAKDITLWITRCGPCKGIPGRRAGRICCSAAIRQSGKRKSAVCRNGLLDPCFQNRVCRAG